jgi:hypothetical protein
VISREDQEREDRAGRLAVAFVVMVLLLPAQAWFFMLTFDVLHDVSVDMPAFSYWWTFLLVLGLDTLAVAARRLYIRLSYEE